MPTTSSHPWKFYRTGSVDQVSFRDGSDIVHLSDLDQKLWGALACPTRGIEFDTRTLDLIDTDKDGRIRAPEMIAAAQWVRDHFKNPDDLLKGGDSVALAAINNATPSGAAILAGARRILQNLGKADATSISLADVTDTAKIFAATRLNGDGVVPADSAEDQSVRKAIEDIIVTHGAVTDRSGKPGVNQAQVDAFFAEAAAFSDWHAKAESDKNILPLGDATANAAASVKGVKAKVDDYFARSGLAAFDSRAAAPLNRAEADFAAIAAKDLTSSSEDIAKLPLARVEAGRALPLSEALNPAWAAAVSALAANAVAPLLGGSKTSLSVSEWDALQAKLAPYESWNAAKPAAAVEKLGLPRIRELLASGTREKINRLIQEDAALETENAQIASVEKLILLQRDFFRLLNNFVSFSDFYSRRGAIFQAGTLYLDGRSCDLCVLVSDAGKHAALAGLAKAYLAYCDCTRPNGEKITIAVAFTAGDSDHLMPGRNGIFYDRKGRDWDATIIKVVENPISIRQAFWSPYKRFVRMIEEQVAKRAATADTAAQGKLGTAATQIAEADKTKPGAKPAEQKRMDVGTVAAIGVALGSIGTFMVGIFGKFIDLGWWIPLAIVGLMLAISLPSMLIAWLKLRQRNLGPILDANGWAVNGRMKINVPFGRSLSKTAKLPPGAEHQLSDPFAEDHSTRNGVWTVIVVVVALFVAWRVDLLNSVLPASLEHQQKSEVSPTNAIPANTTNAAAK